MNLSDVLSDGADQIRRVLNFHANKSRRAYTDVQLDRANHIVALMDNLRTGIDCFPKPIPADRYWPDATTVSRIVCLPSFEVAVDVACAQVDAYCRIHGLGREGNLEVRADMQKFADLTAKLAKTIRALTVAVGAEDRLP